MTLPTFHLRSELCCHVDRIKTRMLISHAGFSLISAIFLLVVLAALGVGIARVSTIQSITSAQDVQGSRAYHAARAGAEWGVFQVMDPNNLLVVPPGNPAWPNLPPCLAPANMVIEGFAVTVNCIALPFTEVGTVRSIQVYQITSTASLGATGTLNAIERQIVITVSKCRTTEGLPAEFYRCA